MSSRLSPFSSTRRLSPPSSPRSFASSSLRGHQLVLFSALSHLFVSPSSVFYLLSSKLRADHLRLSPPPLNSSRNPSDLSFFLTVEHEVPSSLPTPSTRATYIPPLPSHRSSSDHVASPRSPSLPSLTYSRFRSFVVRYSLPIVFPQLDSSSRFEIKAF